MGLLVGFAVVGLIVYFIGAAFSNNEVKSAGLTVATRGCLGIIGFIVLLVIIVVVIFSNGH